MSAAAVSPGFWTSVFRRFRGDRFAVACLLGTALLVVVAALAPLLANEKPLALKYRGATWFPALREIPRFLAPSPELADLDVRFLADHPEVEWFVPAPIPFSAASEDLDAVLAPPGGRHWLGTDSTGRDILARMVHGAGVSLLVGFLATGISLAVGLTLGSLAGFFGGKVDFWISRLIEVVLCFPTMFLVLTVIALVEPSIWKIMVVIGLTSWTNEARFVRAEFLRLRETEFVLAARVSGARWPRIVVRHLLPNSLAPVLVSSSFSVGAAILTEAALSFLGFGVQPPAPSWGNILSQAQQYQQQWWLALFPGLAIFAAVTAYNVVGEAFRDALDPRLAERE